MKRDAAITKLKKHGYVVTFYVQGGVQATKNQRTYKAKSVTELMRIIFG